MTDPDAVRLRRALLAIPDGDLRRAVGGLQATPRAVLFAVLSQVRRGRVDEGTGPAELRRRMREATPSERSEIGFALVAGCADATIAALGDRSEDPSVDDMLGVLDPVIDAHGLPLVTAMLAVYVVRDCPCRATFETLLATDARFVVPEPSRIVSTQVKEPKDRSRAGRARRREERRAARERAAEIQNERGSRRRRKRRDALVDQPGASGSPDVEGDVLVDAEIDATGAEPHRRDLDSSGRTSRRSGPTTSSSGWSWRARSSSTPRSSARRCGRAWSSRAHRHT